MKSKLVVTSEKRSGGKGMGNGTFTFYFIHFYSLNVLPQPISKTKAKISPAPKQSWLLHQKTIALHSQSECLEMLMNTMHANAAVSFKT